MKRLAMDLRERIGKQARGNLPELLNTTFTVVIRRVPNSDKDRTSSKQLQASYTVMRHWEEQIDFIKKILGPKEPYCLTAIFKCTLT